MWFIICCNERWDCVRWWICLCQEIIMFDLNTLSKCRYHQALPKCQPCGAQHFGCNDNFFALKTLKWLKKCSKCMSTVVRRTIVNFQASTVIHWELCELSSSKAVWLYNRSFSLYSEENLRGGLALAVILHNSGSMSPFSDMFFLKYALDVAPCLCHFDLIDFFLYVILFLNNITSRLTLYCCICRIGKQYPMDLRSHVLLEWNYIIWFYC